MSEQVTTTEKPRRRRRRPRNKTANPDEKKTQTAEKKPETATKATNPRRNHRPRRRPQTDKKPTGEKRPEQAAKPTQTAAPVKTEPAKTTTVVKENVANAFVNHDPEPLVLTDRRALHVFVRNLRQIRQLRRYGDIEYVSKKMHYAVIYMNADQIDTARQALSKLSFVRRVVESERPDVDPYVGHGVNANFVTHTTNDGGADAVPTQTEEDD